MFQAGHEKLKKPILQWTREVVNHFWYCASKANSEDEFIVIFFLFLAQSRKKSAVYINSTVLL